MGATSKITHTVMDRIQFLVRCCLEDSFISCLVDSKQGSLQYSGDWLPSQPARESKGGHARWKPQPCSLMSEVSEEYRNLMGEEKGCHKSSYSDSYGGGSEIALSYSFLRITNPEVQLLCPVHAQGKKIRQGHECQS